MITSLSGGIYVRAFRHQLHPTDQADPAVRSRCVTGPPLANLDMFGENGFFPARDAAQSFIPVILRKKGGNTLVFHRWDRVPAWWKNPLSDKRLVFFNARMESLDEKAAYKGAWHRNQRCLIPATEFFEWPDRKMIPDDHKRIEHRVKPKNQEIFPMAGMWDAWEPSGEKSLRSRAIVTTETNRALSCRRRRKTEG